MMKSHGQIAIGETNWVAETLGRAAVPSLKLGKSLGGKAWRHPQTTFPTNYILDDCLDWNLTTSAPDCECPHGTRIR